MRANVPGIMMLDGSKRSSPDESESESRSALASLPPPVAVVVVVVVPGSGLISLAGVEVLKNSGTRGRTR